MTTLPPPPTTILSCGHPPSSHICYECADTIQREELRTAQHFTAYLVQRGRNVYLQTWPGGRLANVTKHWTHRVGFGYDTVRHYFTAIDVHGQRWHGTSPGFEMYARMTRTRTRANKETKS